MKDSLIFLGVSAMLFALAKAFFTMFFYLVEFAKDESSHQE